MIKNLVIVALVTLNLVFAWALYQEYDSADRQAALLPIQATAAPPAMEPRANREALADEVSGTLPAPPGAEIEFDGSYLNLASSLRGQGLDEDLIRQLVYGTLKRNQLAYQDVTDNAYWQPGGRSHLQTNNAELELAEQQRQILVSTFGDDIIDDPLFAELFKPLNDQLPFLTSDKQIAVHEMNERRVAGMRDLANPGARLQETRVDWREAREAFSAAISELLTPDEYFEYQLRNDPLAWRLRNTQGNTIQTEQEFRDLFRIQQEVYDNSAESPRELRPVVADRVQTYLGQERFEEYMRNQDRRYRTIHAIGERYGNSESETIAVYEAVIEAREEVQALRESTDISPDDIETRATELLDDVVSKVERIAGEETADSVRSNRRNLGLTTERRSRRGS